MSPSEDASAGLCCRGPPAPPLGPVALPVDPEGPRQEMGEEGTVGGAVSGSDSRNCPRGIQVG